ncbi:2-amino-4-hydroxy-6-hydroxymethyldihydropteridine diphosphokinase [Halioxenophilus sp. WMMB6]|uniref:2-amino-4-hydroxy-6- hydroxymethyldihydropteridine diphosphokinase n=1 Tax=Halioxenophilus sp. WMMB6 TaxID=3073815 RepID=UPI00295F3784|nr:2-amino-4-hydroxy-6-hydroxymethyldihydropteridine diphosphokinase [Halioxenophilus sp. WMMB6]
MSASPVLAYVALGSNLDDPLHQVEMGCRALAGLESTQIVEQSPWYVTKAIGPGEQPDFINGVVALQTELEAEALLRAMQAIEQAQGRQRLVRWGARTLDLDLLLYGTLTMHSETLTLPHPHLHERNFVVYPLADIAPTLTLPTGHRLEELRATLGSAGVRRLEP